MRTQNQTSVGFFKEQGFAYVRADDIDGDPDDTYVDPGDPYGRTCAERHGQIYTVEDAANIDDHTNGTLNWQPMPRNYKPEETASWAGGWNVPAQKSRNSRRALTPQCWIYRTA